MIPNFDIKLVNNISVEGIDMMDYPDFCDAFIASADYGEREMTEKELDWLMDNYSDWCYGVIADSAQFH